jgi:hypothetical protein
LLLSRFSEGFEAGENPKRVGELVSYSANATVGETFGYQAVVAEGGVLFDCFRLQ